jgi:hypothetical protein
MPSLELDLGLFFPDHHPRLKGRMMDISFWLSHFVPHIAFNSLFDPYADSPSSSISAFNLSPVYLHKANRQPTARSLWP